MDGDTQFIRQKTQAGERGIADGIRRVGREGGVHKRVFAVLVMHSEALGKVLFHSAGPGRRVLDDNHVAVGPWAMELDETLLLQGLRAMEKTRIFDDRMLMAQRQGKTSIYVQCRGEEAIACGQMISGGNRWRL